MSDDETRSRAPGPPTVGVDRTLPPTLDGGASAVPLPHVPGYRFLEFLGQGGMGVVFLAEQTGLKRAAAVKMMTSSDPVGRVRFLAEAEAVAAIHHENVVRVYEFGELPAAQGPGRPYLAMEYLPGGSMGHRPPPATPEAAVALVLKVARGVAAAHAAGIVHRDLKPGNVLFDEHGEPKVTDFGLAKRAAVDLTQTQAVMGTPAYMAPEQAGGKAKFVGPPADVWALGAMLYEQLCGRRPFPGETAVTLLRQVQEDEPRSVRTIAPGVPRDLDNVCRKCLEKDPARRYPSAAELADELQRYLNGEAVLARPVSSAGRLVRWARRKPALAGLVASLVVGALGLIAALGVLYRAAAAEAAAQRQLVEREQARLQAEQSLRQAADAARLAADAEARRANQVSDFMASLFQASDPFDVFGKSFAPANWERQQKRTAADFLDDAAARFRTELKDQPLTRAKLLADIGNSYRGIGKFDHARELLGESLALRAAHLPPDHADTLASLYGLANVALDIGDTDAAEANFRAVLDAMARTNQPEADRDMVRFQLGWALGLAGRKDAEAVLEECVEVRKRVHGPTHYLTLEANLGLASFLIDQGRLPEVGKLVGDLERGMAAQTDGQIRTFCELASKFQYAMSMRSAANASGALLAGPLYAEAETAYKASLAAGARALPPDHYLLGLVRHSLGQLYADQQRHADAAAQFARAHADVKTTVGLAHPKVIVLVGDYAESLAELNRPEEGRALFADLFAANAERFGPGNKWRSAVLAYAGVFEANCGDPAAAAAHARNLLAELRADRAVPNPTFCLKVSRLAYKLWQTDGPLATQLWDEVLRQTPHLGTKSAAGLRMLCKLGQVRTRAKAGKFADTLGTLLEIEADTKAVVAAGGHFAPYDHATLMAYRGRAEREAGRFDSSAAYYRRAGELYDAAKKPNGRYDAACGEADALVLACRAKDAVPALRRVLKLVPKDRDTPDLRSEWGCKLAVAQLAAGDREGYEKFLADEAARAATPAAVARLLRVAALSPAGSTALAARFAEPLKRLPPNGVAVAAISARTSGSAGAGVAGLEGAAIRAVAKAWANDAAARGAVAEAKKVLAVAEPTPAVPLPYATPPGGAEGRLWASLLVAEAEARLSGSGT